MENVANRTLIDCRQHKPLAGSSCLLLGKTLNYLTVPFSTQQYKQGCQSEWSVPGEGGGATPFRSVSAAPKGVVFQPFWS